MYTLYKTDEISRTSVSPHVSLIVSVYVMKRLGLYHTLVVYIFHVVHYIVRNSSIYQFIYQMVSTVKAWAGQSLEPGTPIWYPT